MQAWGTLDAYISQVSSVGGEAMSMADLMVLNNDGETPELETALDYSENLLRQSLQKGRAEDSGVQKAESKEKIQSVLQMRRPGKPSPKSKAQVEKTWRHWAVFSLGVPRFGWQRFIRWSQHFLRLQRDDPHLQVLQSSSR
mmetsp:Transcript_76584/g.123884  ORF Transcript_76584/g.123884 Transcript_76584/m.123884 type:complete len:141 (+) Transcript_76584:752-1174(+)